MNFVIRERRGKEPAAAVGLWLWWWLWHGRGFFFRIEVEKQGFPTAWDIIDQKFQGLGLKLKAVILTFQDLDCN